ncbi:MAG TPA: hypothetical protein VK032_05565 [Burkholderiaceae bacterium]|nr:hypothetical protein [Burkholderiaceae bacterium]
MAQKNNPVSQALTRKPAPLSRLRRFRGSALLLSGLNRFVLTLVPVAVLWLLAGWAMAWW